jgi:hypothetical protein
MEDMVLKIIIGVVPIVIAVTFHEVAHGYAAYRLGDPPRQRPSGGSRWTP